MLDIAIAYNRYKFIGYEFLTWLWFIIEKDPDIISKTTKEPAFLEVGNRLVLENYKNNIVEKIIIKGDDPDLEEGRLALKKGAFVIEINLLFNHNNLKWNFNIKGENFNIEGLKIPTPKLLETKEDLDGLILEKKYLYQIIVDFINSLFDYFIKLRISNNWIDNTVPDIKNWLYKDSETNK